MLVFLPGLGEIMSLFERLTCSPTFGRQDRFCILAAHSSLSTEEQKRIFKRQPPNVRKVVLATNIAETSITIDDVVFVIDTGKMKETRYDERTRLRKLVEVWTDKASMRQRMGRAGRVAPGVCFRLFTKVTAAQRFPEHRQPEMQRVPLQELSLQIKTLGATDVAAFLSQAMDPPSASAVQSALDTLVAISALNADLPDLPLTPLGSHLAKLPVDPHLGKMLIYASVFGCLNPVLTIAACLSYKSPFSSSIDRRSQADEAKRVLGGQTPTSDLLLMVAAYDAWSQAMQGQPMAAGRAIARKFSLSEQTLIQIRDTRRQFLHLLKDIGFLGSGGSKRGGGRDQDIEMKFNTNSNSPAVVAAVCFAGLYPNVLQIDKPQGNSPAISLRGEKEHSVALHPTSILRQRQDLKPGQLITYHHKLQTTRTFVMDATLVHPNAVLLFGGKLAVDHVGGMVTMDSWLTLPVPARTAVMLKELRGELERLLRKKAQRPQTDIVVEGGNLVKAVTQLMKDEGSTKGL